MVEFRGNAGVTWLYTGRAFCILARCFNTLAGIQCQSKDQQCQTHFDSCEIRHSVEDELTAGTDYKYRQHGLNAAPSIPQILI